MTAGGWWNIISLKEAPVHTNEAFCLGCQTLFDRFPGFHRGLMLWFFTGVQTEHADAHISCAGRGKQDQQKDYNAHTSRAQWGQSSHDYNLALDVFQLKSGIATYDPVWFKNVISEAVEKQNTDDTRLFELTWYGDPCAPYKELPHIEVRNWKELVSQGQYKLVMMK
jgi:hypothetical protein